MEIPPSSSSCSGLPPCTAPRCTAPVGSEPRVEGLHAQGSVQCAHLHQAHAVCRLPSWSWRRVPPRHSSQSWVDLGPCLGGRGWEKAASLLQAPAILQVVPALSWSCLTMVPSWEGEGVELLLCPVFLMRALHYQHGSRPRCSWLLGLHMVLVPSFKIDLHAGIYLRPKISTHSAAWVVLVGSS